MPILSLNSKIPVTAIAVAAGAMTSSHILEDAPNAMPGELSAPAHRVIAKAPDGPWEPRAS